MSTLVFTLSHLNYVLVSIDQLVACLACCRWRECGAPSWLAMVGWQRGSGQLLVW